MPGVPDTEPSAEENINPAVSEGLMLNVFVPNPPDAVTGINACISTSCSRVLKATACTADSAGGSSTVNKNVSVAVCGTSSVTVIVNVVCVRVAVGVPII